MAKRGETWPISWPILARIQPHDQASIDHLGLAWLKAGEAEKARSSLKRALELRPDFPDAAEARKALLSLGG